MDNFTLPLLVISSLSDPNTVFSTMLSNIVKLYYPLMAIYHVSHQNKTRYKILYTLIFMSLHPKLRGQTILNYMSLKSALHFSAAINNKLHNRDLLPILVTVNKITTNMRGY
jgi:hypothetical protein